MYTEEVNKIALSSNDDKRLQTFDRIRTYPYGTNALKVCKNEMLSKCKWLILIVIIMKIKQHNSKWPYVPDHPYRIRIIRGSGSGKTNALLNLINYQRDIDKIYWYAKDPYKVKYQFLINKRECMGLKHFNDPKAFIEYWNNMQDVYENIEEYNIGKKRKILKFFDDVIVDMINNKKLNLVVTELFIRGRKSNMFLLSYQSAKRC